MCLTSSSRTSSLIYKSPESAVSCVSELQEADYYSVGG